MAERFRLAVTYEWSLKTEAEHQKKIEQVVGRAAEDFAVGHGNKDIGFYYPTIADARAVSKKVKASELPIPGLLCNIYAAVD
jgi:hypothetical protein